MARGISSRLGAARRLLSPCVLCPRGCGVDRPGGERGDCGCGDGLEVAAVSLHTGEEPVLGGRTGACNVFLTGCNLHCTFCQNHPISHLEVGRSETAGGLASRVHEVLEKGTSILGLVTGAHQVPAILGALAPILEDRPDLTVVWNSGGYERVETLKLLEGIVDVYLPDFKFWDAAVAEELAGATDYPRVAREAIREMARQVGPLVTDDRGLAERGLIVRHLVLPGNLSGTEDVLGWVSRELPVGTAVSLMGQYVPYAGGLDHPVLGRRLEREEYDRACGILERLGLETGWIQELAHE